MRRRLSELTDEEVEKFTRELEDEFRAADEHDGWLFRQQTVLLETEEDEHDPLPPEPGR